TREIYDARLSNNCTVADIVQDGSWVWPNEWLDKFPRLRQVQEPNLQNDIEDGSVWITNTGKKHKFDIKTVWKDMCGNDQRVNWSSMVWFAQSIHRHAFVLWLAVQQKLMTQDRLLIWKPNEVLRCALCNKCPDSHNHLFFNCEYSQGIWRELQKMLNVRFSDCWEHVIEEITSLPINRNIWSILRRLVCGAAVYFIWQERNNILFKNEKRDGNSVLRVIKETVEMKLMGLKVKESRTVEEVETRWNIKLQKSNTA
ncbi:RNA-directed DNA polymerase, eukaryota, reverse transcriptase zinc-binding domain protein, partial [Tanacetum coccineum]